MDKSVNEPAVGAAPSPPGRDVRFFDNRQKYLLFVNTCSEKWVVAKRVAREIPKLDPLPPAIRVFDAGMGDGTILSRVWRALHHRYPTFPFYISGKEVSLEDVRLTLDKIPDRLFEHPASVAVLTNLTYSEAPWLTTRSKSAANRFVWKEVALAGNCSYDFEQQILDLQDFLSENWQARIGKAGNPIYDRPVVLVLYREDHRFLLDPVIPRQGVPRADFDLVIASQPYRASASAEFKASKVITPMARALGPRGRLIGIHSIGDDPGMEIIRGVWPDHPGFPVDRHAVLAATKSELGAEARHYAFQAGPESSAVFRYTMHTLPDEISSAIGTSTVMAAWNAATYVGQVDDQRVDAAMESGVHIPATRKVLEAHNGLWFNDESFVIARKRL